MTKGTEEFLVESTPVIDLRKHGLSASGDQSSSANDGPENWSSEKTEVYVDSDDDSTSACLVSSNGESYPITTFPFVLGRGNECDLVLNGKGVSRKHVEIVFQSGRFVVNDLESLNGIKINGYKVNRVILEEGDEIKLGEVALAFSNGGEAKELPIKTKPARDKSKTKSSEAEVDPFDTGSKKYLKFGAFAAGLILLGGGGYFGLQQYSNSNQAPAGQIIVSSSSPASGSSTNTSQSQASPSSATDEEVTALPSAAPPPSIAAPPPSLATIGVTPRIKSDTDGTGGSSASIQEREPAKPKAEVVRYKKTDEAKALLSKADSKYLSGDADALFKAMTVYENDSKIPSSVRNSLKSKHESLARLYANYTAGKKAYVGGDKSEAFRSWSAFLEKEKSMFRSKRSVYADQVASKVIEVYVAKGNEASQAGEHHKAYQLWDKANKLGDSVAAKIAIDNAHTKARQLYRKALRLEYVNSTQAKELWEEVVQLVPAGTEYHTKASSKLAWYEKWGA